MPPLARVPFVLVSIALAATVGCGGPAPGSTTERLWVSGVPTSTKTEITAFITTRSSGGKYIGAFFRGSSLRGRHDVFEWIGDGKDAAKLRFLQDDKTTRIRIETCEPTRGFDHCILLHGDPTGTKRYQSRKRWVVRRPGRSKDISPTMVLDAVAELAEDDEELQAALVTADEP